MEQSAAIGEPMQLLYLPFTEHQLDECLAAASAYAPSHANNSEDTEPKKVSIEYYRKSIKNYSDYLLDPKRYRRSRDKRQIEKDERFWTAATLMSFRYSSAPRDLWAKLLFRAFNTDHPPVGKFDSWEDAIGDNPALLIEAPLPSPKSYSEWLRKQGSRASSYPLRV